MQNPSERGGQVSRQFTSLMRLVTSRFGIAGQNPACGSLELRISKLGFQIPNHSMSQSLNVLNRFRFLRCEYLGKRKTAQSSEPAWYASAKEIAGRTYRNKHQNHCQRAGNKLLDDQADHQNAQQDHLAGHQGSEEVDFFLKACKSFFVGVGFHCPILSVLF